MEMTRQQELLQMSPGGSGLVWVPAGPAIGMGVGLPGLAPAGCGGAAVPAITPEQAMAMLGSPVSSGTTSNYQQDVLN